MEIFSKSLKSAIRFLVIIAEGQEGSESACSASDLAGEAGVSTAMASKILRSLVRDGILESRKGPGGGFCLARAPGQICLSDVLEAIEGRRKFTECIWGYEQCSAESPCSMHHTWEPLRERMNLYLNETTIAAICHGPIGNSPP